MRENRASALLTQLALPQHTLCMACRALLAGYPKCGRASVHGAMQHVVAACVIAGTGARRLI